ncbi:alpha/beta hydrolase-fold protein [Maricaulis sp.]|uniref:alpha/beta hydrolase n=1 Tax=Maricaulis sp. TaxID=1486257 RepID=UPI0025BDF80B|nr:alpha/beta hydrolase-fold protein [Maricaulis sp.]
MRHDHSLPEGRIHTVFIDSEAVACNRLGDPTRRRVDVYVPHGHDGSGLPLLVDLAGFTGSGLGHVNWKNFGENVPERADRLIATGVMKPAVIAFPDCFTRLGGNQYVNSPAMGMWEDFLITEMLPVIEGKFGCGGTGRRAVFGKSSGGYGALMHALKHPDVWAGAVCHSGDMGFELMFATDFALALRQINKHGGTITSFMEAFERALKPAGDDIHTLMTLAMAATYDPDPDPDVLMGIRLPVTMDTCERIPERWAEWMKFDPLERVDSEGEGLKQLKALMIDCGDIDQYNLLYGARRMTRKLTDMGIRHRYEEFPDTHSSIDYRMDVSLPFLAAALSD